MPADARGRGTEVGASEDIMGGKENDTGVELPWFIRNEKDG